MILRHLLFDTLLCTVLGTGIIVTFAYSIH